jgi:hypothetical protein
MGRKYRALKESLRANPVRSLLVIDDRGLRLKLFSGVESIIKKIDKVERERDNFSSQDQGLFKDWYELTFRQENKEMEERRHEYISLVKFHNDIIAVAEMQEIPPHEAYLYLKEEEKRYQTGPEEQRTTIDKLRKERLEFAQKALEEELSASFDEDYDSEDFDSPLGGEPDLSVLSKVETKLYNHLKSSSPEQLRKEFSGSDGILLAMNAMGLSSLTADHSLFIKIWDSLPPKTRRAVSENFESDTGAVMEEFISELRMALSGEPSDEASKETDSDNLDSEFIQVRQSRSVDLSEREERDLKFIFRKLVRLIHPDSQDPNLSQNLKSWYNKVWQRVQEAYKSKDLHQLKRLEITAMVRLKELNSLTVDEIKASAEWLEEELAELRSRLKSLEKHPAWKFSTKRSYEPLIKKIRKDFQMNLAPILKDIEELKNIHNFYEQASKETSESKRFKSSKKRTSRKKRPHKSKSKKSSQMSLFD